MKAILKFNLDEDMFEYKKATQALDMYSDIDDFYNILRDMCKYDSPAFSNAGNQLDYIMEKFNNKLGVYLND